MMRRALARPLLSVTTTAARPSLAPFVLRARFEHTAPEPNQKRRQFRNGLLRDDWRAGIVPHDYVKEVSQNPQPNRWLIDVREKNEVEQGAIPSSVNLPLSTLPGSLKVSPEDFEKQFGFALPDKDDLVIMYCRSGVRSATACDVFRDSGYTNYINYKGSWLDWVEKEGAPTA